MKSARGIAAAVILLSLVLSNAGCGGNSGGPSRDAGEAGDADDGGPLLLNRDARVDVSSAGTGHGVFTYSASIDVLPGVGSGETRTGSFSYTLTITSQLFLSTAPLAPGIPLGPGGYSGTAVTQIDLGGGGALHVTRTSFYDDVQETVSASGRSYIPSPVGGFPEKVVEVTGRNFEAPFIFNAFASANVYTTSFLVTPFPLTHAWTDTAVETEDCDLQREVAPSTTTRTYSSETGTLETDVVSHCNLPSSMQQDMVDPFPPYVGTPDVAAMVLAGTYDGSGVIDADAAGQPANCDEAFALIFPGSDGIWPDARGDAGNGLGGTCSGAFQMHLHVDLPAP